jgi:hypothetical protein
MLDPVSRTLRDILTAHPPAPPAEGEPPNLDRKSLDRELKSAGASLPELRDAGRISWEMVGNDISDALEVAEAVAGLPVASHPEVAAALETVRAGEDWDWSGMYDQVPDFAEVAAAAALLAVIRDRYAPPKED